MTLNAEQTTNAQQIIAAGKSVGANANAIIIALMVGLDESGLHNYQPSEEPGQEGSSLGIFQQLTGWGSVATRTNPYQSAVLFFKGGAEGQKGLLNTPGWQTMNPWNAAQAVQGSEFSDGSNYHAQFAQAQQIYSQLGGGTYTPVAGTNENASFGVPGGSIFSGGQGSGGLAPPSGTPWWSPFGDTFKQEAVTGDNPGVNGVAAVTDAAKAAKTATLFMLDMLSPSHWLRWLSGAGGIVILLLSVYLIATSTS